MNNQQVLALSMRAICTVGLIWATSVDAAVIDVTPSSMGNWALLITDTSVTYGAGDAVAEMVTGPATPPLGTGSAHFNTGSDGFQSGQLRNSTDWVGTRIEDLTELAYSTYATAWNGQQVPYLTIYLDTDGNFNTREDRLWFEPDYSSASAGNGNANPQPDPALNLWQTWDALGGMWYSDNHAGPGSGAITLAAYLVLEPDATIVDDVLGGKGGIRFSSGFAGTGDTFDANVDAFIIGTAAAGTTTYNFDPDATVPEPATLALLGIGLAGLGFSTRRRRTA